jgi:hypothetical protein
MAIKDLVHVHAADACNHPSHPRIKFVEGIMTANSLYRKRLGGLRLASLAHW